MKYAQVELGELAQIQLGLTLRGSDASQHDPEGTHRLLRISDVTPDGVLQWSQETLIKLEASTAEKAELKPGDVVVVARGARMTAAVFQDEFSSVAGSQFCVVRCATGQIDPTYLRFFLNLPQSQDALMAESRGTYIRALSARSLAQFRIPLPPLERQRLFASLDGLRLQEKHLTTRLVELRDQLTQQTLQQALSGHHKIS
ncbi:MAG: restriction endonuclease subunit S [Verrucomicrobiota bacterium JB022]|nr:restriction endonuclease subunit S [Verrucomicrobiota bacterium JB022]